ncbi:AaceriACR006Cp [[Ashbya] aceris (nom. inval.)]|nr:AaceriACR006Cp [[Ashbya] aceris (nom. inval.)]
MPYHLPVLLNPLVNAVFNCPAPGASPLKKLFNNAKDKKFILVVPKTEVLLQYQDAATHVPLAELCYNYEFVASHTLVQLQEARVTELEFRTINGKSVVIRPQSGIITAQPGAKKCRIQRCELIRSFNDYLLGRTTFALLYIDRPLVGEVELINPLRVFDLQEKSLHYQQLTPTADTPLPLEQFLRLHPQLGNQLDEVFKDAKERMRYIVLSLKEVVQLFQELVQKVYCLIKLDKNFRNYLNLLEMVQEYVELNIYEDVWRKLVQINGKNEPDRTPGYNITRFISLNQLSTNLYPEELEEFDLCAVTEIEKRVVQATECFSKITLTNSHHEKTRILISTFQKLTTKTSQATLDPMIDADTLLGLMVVVVCRSQVKNLKSHLDHLREFAQNSDDVKFGLLGYSLSTLEAVVGYFDVGGNSNKLERLITQCQHNKIFWNMIEQGISINLKEHEDVLISRTPLCESVLSLCIQYGRPDVFYDIISNYQSHFTLEDILCDVNQSNCSLLIQALQAGNEDITEALIDLLIANCTNTEMYAYINKCDIAGRTVGHYLTQNYEIVDRVGKFVNWKGKDLNMHTPLFTVCRAYDHPRYLEILSKCFQHCFDFYSIKGKRFSFADHEDPLGNTLLHIIKNGIQLALSIPGANVNKCNIRGMTPLMVYAKYNRIENIREILNDKRLILSKLQDPQSLKAIDYVKNPIILNLIGTTMAKSSLYGCLSVHNIKFEENAWYLWITSSTPSGNYKTSSYALKDIQSLLQLYSKKHPMSFLPIDHHLDTLRTLGKSGIISVINLENSMFLEALTFSLSIIQQREDYKQIFSYTESELSSWLRTNMVKQKPNKSEKIEPEDIHSIQNFLKFSLTEFNYLREKFTVLKKLIIFEHLKSHDIECSQRILYSQGEKIANIGTSKRLRSSPFDNEFNDGIDPFEQAVDFMCMCLDTLTSKIVEVLDSKVNTWWTLYGERTNLQKEYQRSFPEKGNPNSASSEDSKGFFESYMEDKRQKLESKLQARLSSCSEKLQHLDAELKHCHELLAEEISFFISSKNFAYMNFMVKAYVSRRIKQHKNVLLAIEEFIST